MKKSLQTTWSVEFFFEEDVKLVKFQNKHKVWTPRQWWYIRFSGQEFKRINFLLIKKIKRLLKNLWNI